MRPVLCSVAFAFIFAAPLTAIAVPITPPDDVMAGYYGNTTISTGGRAEVHFIYNVDHTFVLKVPAYDMEFRGTWAVKGSTICFNYEIPPPGIDNPDCSPLSPHKVGDSWTEKSDDGTRKLTLVAGAQ
jgi:hypothetical protein